MIRLTKLADYGVVLTSHMAMEPGRLHTAAALAKEAWVSVPTTSKILKILARQGILESHRGANGGYLLARPPADISVADVIAAMEGPIAVTECVEDAPGECSVESVCQVRGSWQKINDAVRGALAGISLEEMAESMSLAPATEEPSDKLVHISGHGL
jgi:FeS assembly SUF system regulator